MVFFIFVFVSEVVSFDKAGRFKACDDALAAVARARELLLKEVLRPRWARNLTDPGKQSSNRTSTYSL